MAEGRRILRRQSVRDNLEVSLYATRLARGDEARRFDRVFSLLPILKERAEAQAGILSGTQKQMLTIAQALMRDQKLLMLDEPSLGLAPIIVEQVLSHRPPTGARRPGRRHSRQPPAQGRLSRAAPLGLTRQILACWLTN